MIAIIDYDAGNTKSVVKAVEHLGYECKLTREFSDIKNADKLILPGVGSFGDAMEKLERFELVDLIKEEVANGKPILGICLGLQLFFDESDETPGVKGLGLIKGKIKRFPEKEGYKIPHMGWNDIDIKDNTRLFKGIENHSYVYFVHSYYLDSEVREAVAARTQYTTDFDAAVEYGNIFACQFHPEKSGNVGLNILKNYCEV
ncbi:MAG: imidazole glycerol phosphate synthase subunit HisH [Lachnospiraceae bacterium]|nr:imidazole glycerol phosphate synthase subunit HisH [Lachnospiraceae bacterium]